MELILRNVCKQLVRSHSISGDIIGVEVYKICLGYTEYESGESIVRYLCRL